MQQIKPQARPGIKKSKHAFYLFLVAFSLVSPGSFAQVPTITSLSSDTGRAGTSITITGTNFDATGNDVVFFGGMKATVTAGSATSLTVTVPNGAVTYAPVVVTNLTSHLTACSMQMFDVTSLTDTAYSLPDTISNIQVADYFTIADIDGDGKPDVIIPEYLQHYIYVYQNTSTIGHASFAAPVILNISTGAGSYLGNSVAVGDIDGDGMQDLVYVNSGNNTLGVYRNTSTTGSISFATVYTIGSGIGNPVGVAIADLDGDGKLDIAEVNGVVGIVHNTSVPGAISLTYVTSLASSHPNYHIAVGDMDGDGKADIVVGSYPEAVYLNTSTPGSFSFAAQYNCGNSVNGWVNVADMDGDGKLDIQATGNILLNQSTLGNISFPTAYTGNNNIEGSIGDLNGDGKPDASNAVGQNLWYLNASTPGNLNLSTSYNVKKQPYNAQQYAIVCDMDGDGKPDVVTAENNASSGPVFVQLMVPMPQGSLSTSNSSVCPGTTVQLTFTATAGTGPFTLLYNDGIANRTAANVVSGTPFNAAVVPTTTTTYRILSITDALLNDRGTGITGDSVTVIVAGAPTITSFSPDTGRNGQIVTITGTNFSTTAANNVVYFGPVKATVTSASTTQLTVMVPDGATYGFISVENACGLTGLSLKIFSPTASAGFAFSTPLSINAGAQGYGFVNTCDLDGDGKPDLMATGYGGTVKVYRNISTVGNLAVAAEQDVSMGPVSGNWSEYITTGDLDGDGKPDMVVSSYGNTGSLMALRNTSTPGTISFASYQSFGSLGRPLFNAFGDFNGDGKLDVMATNNAAVVLFRNTSTVGTISMASGQSISTTYNDNGSIQSGDIDGDGKPDIICSNAGSPDLTILLNTTTTGATTFSFTVNTTVLPGNCVSMELVDIDGDGKLDVITTQNYTCTVYRNTSTPGSLSFVQVAGVPTGLNTAYVQAYDMNGDGKPDILYQGQNTSSVYYMQNTSTPGNISFASASSFNFGQSTNSNTVVTDFDGDGLADLAMCASNYAVMLRQIPLLQGTFSVASNQVCTGSPAKLIWTATIGTGPFTVVYNDGTANRTATNVSSGVAFNSAANVTGNTIYSLVSVTDVYGNTRSSGFTIDSTTTVIADCPSTWTGATSTNWSTASNWSNSVVPTSCSNNAVIPSGVTNYPVLSANINMGSLTLEAGSSITIGTYTLNICGNITGPISGTATVTGTLSSIPHGLMAINGSGGQTVTGNIVVDAFGIDQQTATATATSTANLTVNKMLINYEGNFTNNGSITLASSAAGDAYYDDFTSPSPGTYIGTMTVQRYISNTANGYRDLSSPVSTTVSNLSSAFSIFGQNGVDCWYAYSPYPNVQIYNEGLSIPSANGNFFQSWVSYTSLSNPLNAMQGIAARTYNGAPYTINLTGTPYDGSQSAIITDVTDGWNLIGNPYPSPVKWSLIKAMNSSVANGSYYVYNTTAEYTGNWGSWNGTTGVNGATDEIAIGQGFFVQTTNPSTSFAMNNTVRTGTAGTYQGLSLLNNEVRLVLGNGTNNDEIVTYTDANATNGYDPDIDAVKMPAGSTVYISYSLPGYDYAINAMNDINVQTVLPLTIVAPDTGSYTLHATELYTPGLQAYLRDAQTGSLTDLSQGAISLSLNGGQTYTGRYSVVFQAVDSTTGITSVASGSTKIYSHGDMIYVNRSGNSAATISVTNLLGQVVKDLNTNNQQTSFEMPTVQPWYAIVKVTEGTKVTVAKVLLTDK